MPSAQAVARRVQVLGFRVQGSGFRVQGSGFRVQGSGFMVQGSGFRVQGPGFRIQGSGCRVQGGDGRCHRRKRWRGAPRRATRPRASPRRCAPGCGGGLGSGERERGERERQRERGSERETTGYEPFALHTQIHSARPTGIIETSSLCCRLRFGAKVDGSVPTHPGRIPLWSSSCALCYSCTTVAFLKWLAPPVGQIGVSHSHENAPP